MISTLKVKTLKKTRKEQIAFVAKKVKTWLDDLEKKTELKSDEQIDFIMDEIIRDKGLIVKYSASIEYKKC